MTYNFKNLYFSLVEYYDKKDYKLDVHALYKDSDNEELLDLDLSKSILPYGYEERYYEESLIPFSDVLYRTKISWGNISLGNALEIKEIYIRHYFKFLRDKGINDINDLENIKSYKKNKR